MESVSSAMESFLRWSIGWQAKVLARLDGECPVRSPTRLGSVLRNATYEYIVPLQNAHPECDRFLPKPIPLEWWEKLYQPVPLLMLSGWTLLNLFPTGSSKGNKDPTASFFSRQLENVISIVYAVFYFLVCLDGVYDPNPGLLEGMKAYSTGVAAIQELTRNPSIALGTAVHFFACDLVVGQAMLWDFYRHYYHEESLVLKGVFTLNLLLASSFCPLGLGLYLVLKPTYYKRYLKPAPQPFLPKSLEECRQERWTDDVPNPFQAYLQWIPQPLLFPFHLLLGALGIAGLLLFLAVYLVYTLVCTLLWAVTFHWPLEGINQNRRYPLKAVVIWSARWRLWWLSAKQSALVEMLRFGSGLADLGLAGMLWQIVGVQESKAVAMLVASVGEEGVSVVAILVKVLLASRLVVAAIPVFLQFGFLLEFLPFAVDPSELIDVLKPEFGNVVPLGDGVAFTKHRDCLELMSKKDVRKSKSFFVWTVSERLYTFSDKVTIFHPQFALEDSLVIHGRNIVKTYIQDTTKVFTSSGDEAQQTQMRLLQMLPRPNVNGKMVEEDLIVKAFGNSFFHLLTGGEFTKAELDAYTDLIKNPGTFFPTWFNFLLGGGALERRGIDKLTSMRAAFLRYPMAPSLTRALDMAKDIGWDPASTVRFLVTVFSIAGAGGPSTLLVDVLKKLFEDPQVNVPLYENNKDTFIKEVARLNTAVGLVTMTDHEARMVDIGRKSVVLPAKTPLHCSILDANRDPEIFGGNGRNFRPGGNHLDSILTWNGMEALFGDKTNPPPRGCPGHDISLDLIKFLTDYYKPDPSLTPLNIIVPHQRFQQIVHKDLGLFDRTLLCGGHKFAATWNANYPRASDALYPGDAVQYPLGSNELPFGQTSPRYDEDDPPTAIIPLIHDLLERGPPVQDFSGEWESAEEAKAFRMITFGNIFPTPDIKMESYATPHSLAQMAFAAPGCFHTQKVSAFMDLPFKVPSDVAYINESLALGKYRVRRGYQKYGAAALFDEKYQIVGIYTCFDSTIALPNEKGWKHACMAWKTSMLALLTVVDHLGKTHLVESNALVSATRRHLSPEHPLRAMAKIFTYRSISINFAAFKTLTPRKALVERTWAFKSDDLQSILADLLENYEFKRLPDNIPESMRDVDENFYPANADTQRFYDIVFEFTKSYFDAIYSSSDDRMLDDDMLAACLDDLANRLKLDRQSLDTLEAVSQVFASLFCTVTAYHEHVGSVSDYFWQPDFTGTTIRAGKDMDSIQAYMLLVSIVASTGVRVPALLGNWTPLLQRDSYSTQTIPIFQKFQSALWKLAKDIDDRNKAIRDAEEKGDYSQGFLMQTFNPRVMESSVSI